MLHYLNVILLCVITFSQDVTYTIYHGEDSIGFLHINRFIRNDTTEIHLSSEFMVSFLGSHHIKQQATAEYIGSSLKHYSMESLQSGDRYYANIHKRSERDYQLDIYTRKTEKKEQFHQNIKNCVLWLYFNNPRNETHIFSENSGEYVPISIVAKNTYIFSINGNDWRFIYDEKGLQRAEFDGFFNFTFIRNTVTFH